MDPWELAEEAASQWELWEKRAIYWRQVATELAAGEREPYPGVDGRAALEAAAPSWARWEPASDRPTPIATSYLLRWWARGERALGQIEEG